jgi:hypothetical protein
MDSDGTVRTVRIVSASGAGHDFTSYLNILATGQ